MNDSLRHAHDRITEEMAHRGLGPEINLCYVDPERGGVIVGVKGKASVQRERVRELARGARLRFVPNAPAVRHLNKQDHIRPLLGGTQIAAPDVKGLGTICIPQGDGYVTAGHVVVRPGVQVYQPRKSDINDWKAGVSTTVSNYTTNAKSDSAYVAFQDVKRGDEIWKSSSSNYNVASIAPAPALGTNVSMQGASTKTALRSGVIAARNVTVTFADGGVLTEQLLANYLSAEGDSGAPVFIPDSGNNVALVGLNVGATEPKFVQPPPDQGTYPPVNGTYAVISTWANVRQDLRL